MFLLTPEEVEITSVPHPRKPKRVPILSYEDKTFRLMSVFAAHQDTEAHAAWRDLADNQGKACVLLEEAHRFSLWRHVRIDQGLLNPTAPIAYIQSCVLMIQAMHSDITHRLGSKQAQKFAAAMEMNTANQMMAVGGFNALQRINPLTDAPPNWEEGDLCGLLLELHRLGSRFFGRKKFVARTLAALDVLPTNDKTVFLTWLQLSLLSHLWTGE